MTGGKKLWYGFLILSVCGASPSTEDGIIIDGYSSPLCEHHSQCTSIDSDAFSIRCFVIYCRCVSFYQLSTELMGHLGVLNPCSTHCRRDSGQKRSNVIPHSNKVLVESRLIKELLQARQAVCHREVGLKMKHTHTHTQLIWHTDTQPAT